MLAKHPGYQRRSSGQLRHAADSSREAIVHYFVYLLFDYVVIVTAATRRPRHGAPLCRPCCRWRGSFEENLLVVHQPDARVGGSLASWDFVGTVARLSACGSRRSNAESSSRLLFVSQGEVCWTRPKARRSTVIKFSLLPRGLILSPCTPWQREIPDCGGSHAPRGTSVDARNYHTRHLRRVVLSCAKRREALMTEFR